MHILNFKMVAIMVCLGLMVIAGCDKGSVEIACSTDNLVLKSTSVDIDNPGFESDFDGWEDTDPSAISSDAYSGSHSAKITGSCGDVRQTVSVNSMTEYELSAYVKDSWRIGVYVDGEKSSRSGNASDWEKETVTFSSGSATSVIIFAQYNEGEGRFDDFELIEVGDATDDDAEDDDSETTVYAYDVLGLQGWKLNAFEGSLGDLDYVDDIQNLETYSNDDWFWTDGEKVYFRCYSGSPTSDGSGNPRVELREMTSDGSDEIYWDGTSDDSNIMEWKVSVERLPSSGKLCFGQIHGPSDTFDDIIRVQAQGDGNQSSGEVRMRILGWVTEDDGGDDETGFYFDLGEELYLRLDMTGGVVTLYLLESDGSVSSTLFTHTGVNSESNYFKAGTYLQSMQDEPYSSSDYGMVAISYINVKH